jgi:ketosteroid isomerase-like protein
VSRRIVPISIVLLAMLVAGSPFGFSRSSPAAAHQASPAASTPCRLTSDEENGAVVRRLFEEGWGQGNLQVLDEVMADDVIVHRAAATAGSIPATTFVTPGPVAYAEAIQVLRTDFSDLRVTIEEVIAAGEMVAMRTTFAGTQADPIENLGAPNTGRSMEREV